ncbi:hypothetical protein Trydic_g17729 [Trypoxylus dichotomus]
MESKDTDELNVLTSQVLDYCNKYSQNENFSSYLRGSVDIKVDSKNEEIQSLIGSENNENNVNTGNIDEQARFPSPTSSITSNRKLEWDNLADIGYGNYVKQKCLHKSLSLPVLTTLEKIQLSERKLQVNREGNLTNHGTQTQSSVKYLPCESVSSSSCKEIPSLVSTETTSSLKDNVSAIDTTSTVSSLSKLLTIATETNTTDIDCTVVNGNVVDSLEKYVGLPMAESTPNNVKERNDLATNVEIEEIIESKPNSSGKNSPVNMKSEEWPSGNSNLKELKCVAKCFRNNIKHLSLTKPLAVECHDIRPISDKDIQTSTIIETISVAIQTDDYRENYDNIAENKIQPIYEEKRIVEYVKHRSSIDESSVRSLGTNTDSNIIMSRCNSFEYLCSDNVVNSPEIHKNRIENSVSDYSSGDKNVPRTTEIKKGIMETEKTSDASSKANPLAELISTKLSEHVITDVEKNDDQAGTATVVKANESPGTSSLDQKAQKAEPQIPVNLDVNKEMERPKRKHLEINTFSTEILPEEVDVETCAKAKQPSKLKDARFTIASHFSKHKTSDELSQIGDVNLDHSLSPQSNPQTSLRTSDSSGESKSFGNWKEKMTRSEKLLEDKLNRMRSGDTTSNDSDVLNFAKKERENQINWINSEISHLTKLKSLLQKKEKRNKSTVEALLKPQPEGMVEKNKTTAVYVITTEKSNISSTSSYKSTRKPVISQGRGEKCQCLFDRKENLGCDSSDCPLFLKHNSDKSLKLKNFNKMLKKDIKMLPHLANFPEFQCDAGIENARLIASEVYPGSNPDSCVKRYVFEIPVDVNECPFITKNKYEKILGTEHTIKPYIPKLPNCDIMADAQNAKLIASEICKGTTPNTCIRRYVFEIPVYNKELPSERSSETSSPPTMKSNTSSFAKKSRSSKESLTSVAQQNTKLKLSDSESKLVPKLSCECKDFVQPMQLDESNKVEVASIGSQKCESSDIVCVCQLGDKGKNEPCSCPRKKYRVCVEKTDTSDIVSYVELPNETRKQKYDTTENSETVEQKTLPPTRGETGDSPRTNEETVVGSTSIQMKASTEFSDNQELHSTGITKIEAPSEIRQNKPYRNSYTNTEHVQDRKKHRHPVSDRAIQNKPKYKHRGTSSISEASMDDKSSKKKRSYSKGLITGIGSKRHEDSSSDDEEHESFKGNRVQIDEKVKVYSTRYLKVPQQRIREEKEAFHITSPSSTSPSPTQVSESVNTVEVEKRNKGNQYQEKLSRDKKVTTTASLEKQDKKRAREPKKTDTTSSSYESDISESSFYSEDAPRICLCCNTAEAKYRSKLRDLPDQLRNALCDPCYFRNEQMYVPGTRPGYTYPGHVCSCYTVVKTEVVRNIQRTVQELEDLERERDFCSCTYGYRLQQHSGRKAARKKSIAYTLTFQDVEKTDSEDDHRRHHKKPPLDEVLVRIPRFVKKSLKDQENRRKSKHDKHSRHSKNRKNKKLTLQDHLLTNRPNFIANAEERRKALIQLAYMREERCEKYKQLLAKSNGKFPEYNVNNKPSKPRMFTSKEMKEITAKNYKKLPEVQKKLEENRNAQIKKANKILSDVFNRKLRERVLKGKLTLSTSASVIHFP